MRRLALCLIALGACGKKKVSPPAPPVSAPVASASVSPPATAGAKLLVLVDEDAPREGGFAPNGDIVAVSDGRLWRFHPGDDVAKTMPLPAGHARLAVAKAADVSVAIVDGKAHPFRDGRAGTPFGLEAAFGVYALSDDGRIFAARSRNGRETTHLYDLGTGKRLSTVGASIELSPDGKYVLTDSLIASTADGKAVVPLAGETSWTRTAAWMGGKVMAWAKDEVVVADPETRAVTHYPAKCPADADVRDYVDAVNEQAFRYCRGTITVVGLDGTRRELQAATNRPKSSPPQMYVAASGSRLVLVWHDKEGEAIDTLDLATGKSEAQKAMPPLRAEDQGAIAFGVQPKEIAVSADRKLVLSGATVVDAASGRELARWGAPRPTPARSPLAAFLNDGGLEIVADAGPHAALSARRIGPATTMKVAFPPLSPGPGCPDSPYDPKRVIDGTDAFYSWPYGGSCACSAKKCGEEKAAEGTIARRGKSALVGERGLFFVDGETKTPLPLNGNAVAATFIGPGSAAVLAEGEGGNVLTELTLSPPAVVTTRTVPETTPTMSYQVIATTKNLITVASDTATLTAEVWPRTTSTTPLATVHAWPGQAIALLANGHVEVFGDLAVSALACAQADGTVRPFATCRAELESRDGFRID